MRARLAVVLALAIVSSTAAPSQRVGAAAAARTRVVHLRVDGSTRSYRVHRPPVTTAVPLVLVLHGAGATAAEVERRYHWDPLADREGFVVAYPQALGRRWQDGGAGSVPGRKDVDVDFLRAVLDDVAARYRIDANRVFVTGISNGGVMTYRAGCALAGRVAAIGPVAAWFPDCLPTAPVSVIHVHGLEDTVLAFDGGGGYPPVLDGLASWREADGCAGTASERRDGQVAHTSWAACPAGVAVELYTIEQGRHEWPGADPKPGNDPVSRALDATPVIWAFLRAHPLV